MKNLQQIVRNYGSKTQGGACCNSNPLMKEWMFDGLNVGCDIPPLFADHNQEEATKTIVHSVHNNHPYTLTFNVVAVPDIFLSSQESRIYYGGGTPYSNNPYQVIVDTGNPITITPFTVLPGEKVWFYHKGDANVCSAYYYYATYTINGTSCEFSFQVYLETSKNNCP